MNRKLTVVMSFGVLVWIAAQAIAQTTTFTYRGNLGLSINGSYDLQFKLFDALTGGVQQGSTVERLNITVTNGDYKVNLDFGACSSCFNGADRFLEVGYRLAGGGIYTVVSPREQITSSPYAIKSSNSTAADGLSAACVNCVNSGQIVSVNGSAVTGTIPVPSVPSGSGNYIQNTTTQQPSASFNISGTGSANVLNAGTQFNLNGLRMLYVPSWDSIFVGSFAGSSNTGWANSFFGGNAGLSNTSGYRNSFFGAQAGQANTTGGYNSFFGAGAGFLSTTASFNSFFGEAAGNTNVSGQWNTFFGSEAGRENSSGSGNSFFGTSAGRGSKGSWNTFIGNLSGNGNTTGEGNTLVGYRAEVGANNLTNGTAIGANAQVNQSNSLVLGSINGVNGATADTKVGIGTTAPATRLHVSGTGVVRARINSDSNAGIALTLSNQPGWSVASVTGGQFQIFNDAMGQNAIWIDATTNNVGIGNTAPSAKLTVTGNTTNSGNNTAVFEDQAIGPNVSHVHYGTSGDWYIRSASSTGNVILQDSGGNVGIGTSTPNDKLDVAGYVRVSWLSSAGYNYLCRNASYQISLCSSSLRYKTNIVPFSLGLSFINRLRPITFDWKQGGMKDVGFGAEDVAQANPLFVTYNDKGEVEGVKYDRLSAAFVNAFKEQQAQIERQQREIEALRKLVCSMNARAEICKDKD
jgi:hypothetical protein